MSERPKITTLIADADNTLYNWVEYIVPCLETMVNHLSRRTGLDPDRIAESFKEVFEKYRTNEYPFVLQEAEIFAELRRDFPRFQEELIKPTRALFHRTRKENLRLYPGVAETLWTLINRGIKVIVLSDAPAFSAEQRLEHLGLSPYIWALYALETYPLPEAADLEQAIINRIRTGFYRSRIGKVVELPLEYEKPNPAGLQRLLDEEGISPRETILVGDNPKKDIRIARELGLLDVWARYGTVISPEMRAKLNHYSAASIQKRNVAGEGEISSPPTHTIDAFPEIIRLFD
ncbi:MAG: HAD family hydrolase [Candidatus Erginobacter occultus]|nr:HAD family hydrolase [Candidatus Erginobacter occultus]